MEQPEGGRWRGRSTPRTRRSGLSVMTGVVIGAIIGIPAVSLASITTQNFLSSQTEVDGPLLEVYDYQQGSNLGWDTITELELGTFSQTVSDLEDPPGTPLDAVTLEVIGPDGSTGEQAVTQADTDTISWWDTDWQLRRCLELDHTAANAASVTEYQYRLEFDLDFLVAGGYLQADYGDFRAISAAGTQLPLWVDGYDDAVWIQVDAINAGASTNFCLYFDHVAADRAPLANHTEEDVFTYSTPKPIYYAVHDDYGAGAGVDIDIASLVDGNSIIRDGVAASTQTLNSGQLSTFSGLTEDSVFATTGPVTARVAGIPTGPNNHIRQGAGFDSLVPISWASTDFIVPSERARQRLHFYAPFADATVDIYDGGGAPLATIVVPVGQAVWVEPPGDPINNESIIVESDVPVLLMHDRTSAGNDVYPVAPFLDEEWLGVSSSTRIGADSTTTHIDQFQSNGPAEIDRALNRGDRLNAGFNGSQGGNFGSGTLLRLDTDTAVDPESSPDARFAAISQADADGNEAVTFFPRQELNNRYLIPTNSQYITFSCPDPDVVLTISTPTQGSFTRTCAGLAGAPVGWAKITANLNVNRSAGATPGQSIEVSSDNGEPFYVYYEHRFSNDETNVLGMKQARQYTWPEPVETERFEGLFQPEGTWLSPIVMTPLVTGIYGQLEFDGIFEDGVTNIRVQVATGPTLAPAPSGFVGPDGTAATFFEIADLPSVLDFVHDGDPYIRLQVTLETNDQTKTPQLQAIDFDYNLPLVQRDLAVPSPIAVHTVETPNVEAAYLLRVKTPRPSLTGSTIRLIDGGASASVVEHNLRLENVAGGVASTQSSNGVFTLDPQAFDAGHPVSVIGDFSLSSSPNTGQVLVFMQVDINTSGILAETDVQVLLETP